MRRTIPELIATVFAGDQITRNKERNARLAALDQWIAAHAERIAALEASRQKDGGVWSRGVQYEAGDLVSYRGSGWICLEQHTAGADFEHTKFRLFVKKGADGKCQCKCASRAEALP